MKIQLTTEVAKRLKYYTKFASGEISGLGKLRLDEDNKPLLVDGDTVIVEDIVLYEQECTSASTDLDEEAMQKFFFDIHSRGESSVGWNVWWHTHANFGVFWSPKDNETISGVGNLMKFLVSIVTNKKGDFLGRIDIYPKDMSPFKKNFLGNKYDANVEIILDGPNGSAISSEIISLRDEETSIKARLEEIKTEINTLSSSIYDDQETEDLCEEEVKEKVKSKYKYFDNRSGLLAPTKIKFDYSKGYSSKKKAETSFEEVLKAIIGKDTGEEELDKYVERSFRDIDEEINSFIKKTENGLLTRVEYLENTLEDFSSDEHICMDCYQAKIICDCKDKTKHDLYFENLEALGIDGDELLTYYMKQYG